MPAINVWNTCERYRDLSIIQTLPIASGITRFQCGYVCTVFSPCPIGIILPTALDYLTVHFHGPEWIFGLSISAFSISNLVAGPILGSFYDRTRAVRAIVLVANLFEIGGEVQHSSQVLYAVDEGLHLCYMAEMYSCSQLLLIGCAMCKLITFNSLVAQHSSEAICNVCTYALVSSTCV